MTAPFVLQRTVFPPEGETAARALYVDGPGEIAGRETLHVAGGGTVSLGTYFNSFAAAYWRRYAALGRVVLTVDAAGRGTIDVVASDAHARPAVVGRIPIDGSGERRVELDLARFDDGGAIWLDLRSVDGLELRSARWTTDAAPRRGGAVTVVIATFNRPDDCAAQLRAVGGDPALVASLAGVVVVDQGDAHPDDADGFAAASALLGDRLRIVRQPNLGGSGGYSRGMLEALAAGDSDAVLLLDDDARAEPEAIARAIAFFRYAAREVVVGGVMLHIDAPTRLYAQSEQWDDRISWFALGRDGAYDVDFAETPWRGHENLHRVERSDFNGWWMCLLPTAVLRRVGLAQPLFLKGDDVEFGLRAGAAGVETVSLPGVAVWHLGWGSKLPTHTWEAYFLHRNRLITALLHSTGRYGRLTVLHAFLGDLKLLSRGHTAPVALRARATRDAVAGPGALPGWLATRVVTVRAAMTAMTDAASRRSPAGTAVAVIGAAAASAARHARLLLGWPRLAARFRASAGDATSVAAWRRIIEDAT